MKHFFSNYFFEKRKKSLAKVGEHFFSISKYSKTFVIFLYFKQKRNETKFFLRGEKKPKCLIIKKRNVDIPTHSSHFWKLQKVLYHSTLTVMHGPVRNSILCRLGQKKRKKIFGIKVVLDTSSNVSVTDTVTGFQNSNNQI